MRVIARQADPVSAPSQMRPYLGQTLVTVGSQYDVHALAVFQGITLFQVIDDLGYPGWKPAWLFDTVDPAIPADWVCSVFHDDPGLVLGPSFVAESAESYSAMVELDPAQVDRFWNRVRSHRPSDKGED